MPKFQSTQSLVEIEEIRDNTIVMEGGSLRQILMVSGVNFALKSEDDQELLIAGYQNFLNALDFPIQIIIHSRKINVQKYLSSLEEIRDSAQSPIMQNQIEEYKEFISQFVKNNAIMEKEFLVIVPWYPSGGLSKGKKVGGILSFLPFVKKKKNEKENIANNPGSREPASAKDNASLLPRDISQLKQRVAQVVDALSAMELGTIVLNNEQLMELLYNFYNPGNIEKEELSFEGISEL